MPIFATNTGTFSPLSIKGIHGAGSAVGDFLIQNSLRFDSSSSSYLHKTPVSVGNRKTFTFSAWVKRSSVSGGQQGLFNAGTNISGDSDFFGVRFFNTNFLNVTTGSTNLVTSTGIFTDVAAWYHIVVTGDTNLSTNKFKIYVNGVLNNQGGILTDGTELAVGNTNIHEIGRTSWSTNEYFDGYLSEVHYIDGAALSPTDFGEFNSETGIWTPIQYTGNHNATTSYSNYVSTIDAQGNAGSNFTANEGPEKAFDGSTTTRCRASANNTIVFDLSSLNLTGSFEFYATNATSEYSLDGGTTWTASLSSQYTTATSDISGVSSIQLRSEEGTTMKVTAFRNQGNLLIDGVAGVNGVHLNFSDNSSNAAVGYDANGTVRYWPDVTGTNISSTVKNLFDGNTGLSVDGNHSTTITFTPSTPIPYSSSVECYTASGLTERTYSLNGGTGVTNVANGWTTLATGSGTITSISNTPNTNYSQSWSAIRVDGVILTDPPNDWTVSGLSGLVQSPSYNSIHGSNITEAEAAKIFDGDDATYGEATGDFIGFDYSGTAVTMKVENTSSSARVFYIQPNASGNFANAGTWSNLSAGTTSSNNWSVPGSTTATATFTFPANYDGNGRIYLNSYSASLRLYSMNAADVTDIVKDSPMSGDTSSDTGLGGQLPSNYATLNGLQYNSTNGVVLSDGNLKVDTTSSSSSWNTTPSTIAVSSGKWLCEVTINTLGSGAAFGVTNPANVIVNSYMGAAFNSWTWFAYDGAGLYTNGSYIDQTAPWGSGGSYPETGDVIGMALDMDAGTLKYYRNGTLLGTAFSNITGPVCFGDSSNSSHVHTYNFGQHAFAYPVTGYKSVCAANLSDSDSPISDGTTALSIVEWDGVDGTADTVSGLNLVNDPGLIWVKATNHGYHNTLWDKVRGYNLTNALITDYNGSASGGKITSVTPSSFSHDGGVWFNENTRKYVAWAWDAGSTTSTIAVGGSNSQAFDQSQRWRDYLTSSIGFHVSYPKTKAFNGVFDGGGGSATDGTNGTVTFTPPAMTVTSLEVSVYNTVTITLPDGTSQTVNGVANADRYRTVDVGSGFSFDGSNSITFTNNNYVYLERIRINGKELVDDDVAINTPEVACDVRANQTSGFSVVKVANPTTTEARVHGLTKAPEFIMAKATATLSENWHTFHVAFGKSHYGIFGPSGTNSYNTSDQWGSQEPNPTTFYVKPATGSGANYAGGMIYYIWHSVPGFSAFGSFEGNDLDPGPFVHLGFKPALILLKNGDANGDWIMHDTTRSPYNEAYKFLRPNSSDGQNATANNQSIDILSNGFRIKAANSTNDSINGPNNTITYCAWAENPFNKGSLAV